MYIDGRKVLGYVGNTVHKVSIFIEKIVKIFTQQRKTVVIHLLLLVNMVY